MGSVMKVLGAVFAIAIVTAAGLSSATYGRNEPRAVNQIAPLQMMVGQHLAPQEMTDYTVVFP